MTKTVYLDALDDVIAESGHGLSLAEAQAQNPAIVQAVFNAPDAVRYKGSGVGVYHRLVAGDGTQIAHYAPIPDLAPVVAQRAALVDARTVELLESGRFEFPPASGNFFPLSRLSLQFIGLANQSGSFPVLVPMVDGLGVFSVADAPTMQGLTAAAFAAMNAIVQSGEQVKEDLRDAPTYQLLLLVEDPR